MPSLSRVASHEVLASQQLAAPSQVGDDDGDAQATRRSATTAARMAQS
jgi:hypothetical protein